MKQLRKHFGSLAFDTVIPDLAQFEKSVTDRIPITLHAPSSEEAGIARQFFDEVASRIEGLHGGSTARRGQILHGRAVTAAQS
jgi:cellulose biosynthesis protein BcsQ